MTPALSVKTKSAVDKLTTQIVGDLRITHITSDCRVEWHWRGGMETMTQAEQLSATLNSISSVTCTISNGGWLHIIYSVGRLTGASRTNAVNKMMQMIKKTIAHKLAMLELGELGE